VEGITAAELATVRGRLEAFAVDIFESLPRTGQRAKAECYLRGLMGRAACRRNAMIVKRLLSGMEVTRADLRPGPGMVASAVSVGGAGRRRRGSRRR
jgi:hypothetical protein